MNLKDLQTKILSWRRLQVTGSAILALFGLAILGQWWPGDVERIILPSEIQAIGGYSYYVHPLGLTAPRFFEIRVDTNNSPEASGLSIREDGRLLGASHTVHAAITTRGRGVYSHWGDSLYFSSSDNSDPRTNGRLYVVRAPLAPGAIVSGVLGLGLALCLAMASRGLFTLGPSTLLASIRVVVVGALVILIACFAYLLRNESVDALATLRKTAIKLAMYALWVACGAIATVWMYRRDLRSGRLVAAIVVLGLTAWALWLRVEVYGGTILPKAANVLGPMAAGAIATMMIRAGFVRALQGEFWRAPLVRRQLLTGAIVFALVLAAPMIWSPIVEHWNASGWADSSTYEVSAHNIASGKVVEGNSQYMPVYQYGLAAVYYIFGHFFFAQQLVNVVLSLLMVLFLCLAAWNLYGNLWAVLLIGLWVAVTRQLFYVVHFTQIESWYIPIVVFGIFAWARYWRTPSTTQLVVMALAASVGINTRNQGAFFFCWLCLAPLFIASASWRRRLAHSAIALTILAVSLVPWTLRNYVVDQRLSPSSTRTALYVAILNDPRVGFYGIRYWEGWNEVAAEYVRRYPDPVERDRVMMRAGLSTPFTNFDWFCRAMFWRTLSFYGLLPTGIFAPDGIVPTNWNAEWRPYLFSRSTALLFLLVSSIGLLTRLSGVTLFMAGGVIATVAVSALTGGNDERVSYPILPLHMLLALAAVFPPCRERPGLTVAKRKFARPLAGAALVLCALGLLLARQQLGRPNLYAPLREREVIVDRDIQLEPTLPSLNDYAASRKPAPALDESWDGRRVRLRLMALNYQCPPKYAGELEYLPHFATDPAGETYYCATLLVNRSGMIEHLPIGVRWSGATMNQVLREGDEVEAEGTLLVPAVKQLSPYLTVFASYWRYWVNIERARRVPVRTTEIPAFF